MRRPIDEDSKAGGLDSSGEAGGAGGGGGGGGGKGGKKRKNSLMQVRRPYPKTFSPHEQGSDLSVMSGPVI